MSDLKITLPYITKIENIGIQPKTHGIEWFDSNDNSRGKGLICFTKEEGEEAILAYSKMDPKIKYSLYTV
jgi:hypothetical protein